MKEKEKKAEMCGPFPTGEIKKEKEGEKNPELIQV